MLPLFFLASLDAPNALAVNPAARPAAGRVPERYFRDNLEFAQAGAYITKELATQDITQFCRVTTKNQAEGDVNRAQGMVSEEDILNSNPGYRPVDSWLYAYYPSAAVRAKAFTADYFLHFLKLNSFAAASEYLHSPSVLPSIRHFELANQLDHSQDPELLQRLSGMPVGLASLAACNELVWGTECPRILKQIQEESVPNSRAITQIDLYREIFADTRYDEGLRLTALKILQRAQANNLRGAHFFDDLRSAFRQSGMAAQEAETMTWKMIGLFGTGGANTGLRAFFSPTPSSTVPKKVAIAIIGDLVGYLDSLTIASGSPYSLPREVHSTCDTGKPYHFWLTAYLAWKRVRNGASPRPAAAAAFIANKGYQMLSNTAGRKPERPLTEHFLAAYANSIRMDLAMAGAGAVYGASVGAGSPPGRLDVNEGVKQIVFDSQEVPKVKPETSKAFTQDLMKFGLRWTKLMAPNSAFRIYEKTLP